MGYSFYFSSLYFATYIELYICQPIQISYMNFKAVLALPKTARSAQTHKRISFIWIVWSTLYVYLWLPHKVEICWRVLSSATDIINGTDFLVPIYLPVLLLTVLAKEKQ